MSHQVAYVTPAGYICTCGVAAHTPTGAGAARSAASHAEHNHAIMGCTIIDYRLSTTHGREPLDTSSCPDKNDVCQRDSNSGETLSCPYHYQIAMAI